MKHIIIGTIVVLALAGCGYKAAAVEEYWNSLPSTTQQAFCGAVDNYGTNAMGAQWQQGQIIEENDYMFTGYDLADYAEANC